MTSNTTPKILTALIDKQVEAGMTNQEFAAHLGISRSHWVQTRNGKKRVHLTLLQAIARTYPDMDGLILEFLRNDDSNKPIP